MAAFQQVSEFHRLATSSPPTSPGPRLVREAAPSGAASRAPDGAGVHCWIMHALWTGHIACALISVPVRLYAATEDPRPRMHQVHAADGSRIRHRRVCEAEAREVSEAEIGRGWEAPDGRMVVLRDEDLDHLPLATRKTVEIVGFVGENDVDPLLYDRGYFAAPDGQIAERPYALLVSLMLERVQASGEVRIE